MKFCFDCYEGPNSGGISCSEPRQGKVTNCGDFYVYYLEKVGCIRRYCAAPSLNPPVAPNPECRDYKVMDDVRRSVNNGDGTKPSTIPYKCDSDRFPQYLSPEWKGAGWYREVHKTYF